jgi:transcriptional regulator with XRE-family HTH domain
MSAIELRGIKENVTWNPVLIRMLRGERTLTRFSQLLGLSKQTVSDWEAGRARPGPEQARLLSELAKQERFLSDWQLAGSMELVGDLEEGSREAVELFKQSIDRSSRQLTK